jgi:hypothetical protein
MPQRAKFWQRHGRRPNGVKPGVVHSSPKHPTDPYSEFPSEGAVLEGGEEGVQFITLIACMAWLW